MTGRTLAQSASPSVTDTHGSGALSGFRRVLHSIRIHRNSIAILGALVGLFAAFLPALTLYANRVIPIGDALSFGQLQGGISGAGAFAHIPWHLIIVLSWAGLSLVALLPRSRIKPLLITLTATFAAAGVVGALTWGAASQVTDEYARVSLSRGAWLSVAAIYISLFAVYNEWRRYLLIPIAVLVALLWLSPHEHFGVFREYLVAIDSFHEEFLRHFFLVAAALPLVIVFGFTLGVITVRQPKLEGVILGIAGFLQTIPSIALFGLLLPILSSYGKAISVSQVLYFLVFVTAVVILFNVLLRASRSSALQSTLKGVLGILILLAVLIVLPVLTTILYSLLSSPTDWLAQISWSTQLVDLGVRGLGATPALIALVLYGIFPLITYTHSGLKSVPRDVLDAAQGIGMSARQTFWKIEVPLVLPFILEGIRSAILMLISLTTVAVLVNAGGLGFFLMRGTEQGIQDLVLLGAIPAVLLALAVDVIFQLLTSWVQPKGLKA